MAGPSHGFPIGTQWEEASIEAGFPGCLFFTTLFNPASTSLVGDGANRDSSSTNSPSFGLDCGEQTDPEKDC